MPRGRGARTRVPSSGIRDADRGRRSYRNPALAAERARKRGELLDATEQELIAIQAASGAPASRCAAPTRSAWRSAPCSAAARSPSTSRSPSPTATCASSGMRPASPPKRRTSARIAAELKPAALDWLTALRAPAIQALQARAPRRANAAPSSGRAPAPSPAWTPDRANRATISEDRRPPSCCGRAIATAPRSRTAR